MNDGVYTIEVTLTGGSGKASITSPMQINVSDGIMTAKVEWSSSKYDLMIVDGEQFLPVNETGNSVFEIPVYTFDEPLSVQAETLAMSEPHLIDYDIVFDMATLISGSAAADTEGAQDLPLIPLCIALAVVIIAAAGVLLFRKGKKKKDE